MGTKKTSGAVGSSAGDARTVAGTVGSIPSPHLARSDEAVVDTTGQRYALAVSGGHVGVWDWNLKTDKFYVDPSLGSMLGYEGEEIGDDRRTWRRRLHADDRDRVDAEVKAHLKGRTPRIHLEHRVLHRDGGTRWFLIEGAAVRDAEGRPIRLLGTATDVTERKWLQDRDNVILRTSMDGFWVADGRGNIIEVNDSYCRLVGYSHDELLSMKISDIEVVESPEEIRQHIRRIQETGSDRFETRHRCKDGTIVVLEVSSNYMETDGGRFFTFIRDVTERKRAEESLRAALFEISVRNRIAEIFLNTPDEEVFADVLAVVLDALESRYGYFGYLDDKGDLVCPSMTRDIWDRCQVSQKSIVFPRETWKGIWGRSLLQRKTLCSNGPFEVPNGHVPLKRVLVVPIFHQGELIGQFAVANCPTDYGEDEKSLLEAIAGYVGPVLHARLEKDRSEKQRQEAEEALRKSEARYRDLVEMVPHGIQECDASGVITFLNSALCRMNGYVRDELLGTAIWDHLADDSEKASLQEYLKQLVAEQPPPVPYMTKNRAKDGTTFDLQVDWDYELDAQGEVTGFIAVITDVTERKRVEEALRKAHQNLERRVKERTSQLTMANQTLRREIAERKRADEKLRQSQKRLAEAEKLAATGRMAARVAHEINNPLAGVKNAVRVIRETVPSDYPRYAHFGRIDKEIDRIARIVRQMLDLHRAERETGTEMDLEITITDVVVMLEPLSEQYGVRVDVRMKNAPIRVVLPENALRQILFNLLANAIEASPVGAAVKLSAARSGDTLTLRIADSGPGIPEQSRSRIFEPFFTTKDRATTGGLGLGLSISKNIVDSLGGSLDVESKPGGGCVFQLCLPLTQTDAG